MSSHRILSHCYRKMTFPYYGPTYPAMYRRAGLSPLFRSRHVSRKGFCSQGDQNEANGDEAMTRDQIESLSERETEMLNERLSKRNRTFEILLLNGRASSLHFLHAGSCFFHARIQFLATGPVDKRVCQEHRIPNDRIEHERECRNHRVRTRRFPRIHRDKFQG